MDFCKYFFSLKDLHFILSNQDISKLIPTIIESLYTHKWNVSHLECDIPQFLYNLIEFTSVKSVNLVCLLNFLRNFTLFYLLESMDECFI